MGTQVIPLESRHSAPAPGRRADRRVHGCSPVVALRSTTRFEQYPLLLADEHPPLTLD